MGLQVANSDLQWSVIAQRIFIKIGLHGAVYAATKSGWFDMPAFEVWFNSVFLEALKIVLEENSLFNKTPDLF